MIRLNWATNQSNLFPASRVVFKGHLWIGEAVLPEQGLRHGSLSGEVQSERAQKLLRRRFGSLVVALEENQSALVLAVYQRGVGRQQQEIDVTGASLERILCQRQESLRRVRPVESRDQPPEPDFRRLIVIVGCMDDRSKCGARQPGKYPGNARRSRWQWRRRPIDDRQILEQFRLMLDCCSTWHGLLALMLARMSGTNGTNHSHILAAKVAGIRRRSNDTRCAYAILLWGTCAEPDGIRNFAGTAPYRRPRVPKDEDRDA